MSELFFPTNLASFLPASNRKIPSLPYPGIPPIPNSTARSVDFSNRLNPRADQQANGLVLGVVVAGAVSCVKVEDEKIAAGFFLMRRRRRRGSCRRGCRVPPAVDCLRSSRPAAIRSLGDCLSFN